MENCIKIILLSFYDIVFLCRLYMAKRSYSCKKKVRESCQKCKKLVLFFHRLATTCGHMVINNTAKLKLRIFYP